MYWLQLAGFISSEDQTLKSEAYATFGPKCFEKS